MEHMIRANQVTLNSCITHAFWIYTGAIVTHSNDHLVTFIGSGKPYLSRWRFALSQSNLRFLNSVIYRVSPELQPRSSYFLNHSPIAFRLLALRYKLAFLTQVPGYCPLLSTHAPAPRSLSPQ